MTGTLTCPIVFLDVDGVLNSHQWFESLENAKATDRIERHIDPAAVVRLERIFQATGASVVISSAWRHGQLYDILIEGLKRHGFTGPVIGKTIISQCSDCVRGNLIDRWLKDNMANHWSFRQYVILDDDADMLYWQKGNFVKTDSSTGGLTDELTDKAIAILKQPNGEETL
jgi:hypothetical protein